MYERSAIVLERYFENLLGFNKANNLKQNFKNYCDLFEKFNVFQDANSAEFNALAEFQDAENAIEEIQNSEEKLYKKNAKLEYNRDLIFNDITQKPEEIEKCIIKIENDISKNQANLISLREKFVEAVRVYNEKKSKLAKCKKTRRNAEKEYNASFELLKQSIENIEEEYVEIAKNFATDENQEQLVSIMADNGKDEKIQFNNAVLTSAAKLGFDILKREAEVYVEAYQMSKKLINELLEGAVSVELHQKVIRNANVKLGFINAEKEYLVQFLDYERITVIYGKRTHRTLMLEACEKFDADTAQINNLYTLLLKEIANKSTKKGYKELYNKSYLIDIEEKDAKFKKEKNKMNLPVGTIMNSNYWRIEGVKNIYTVFYKTVSEVFGKDLVEFDLPKEQDEPENIDEIEVVQEPVIEKAEVEKIEVKEELVVEEIAPVAEIQEIKTQEPVQEIVEEVIELPNEEIVEQIAQKITEDIEETAAETIENIEIAEEPVEEIVENIEVVEEIQEKNAETEIVEVTENIEVIEKVPEEKKAKKVKRYTRKIVTTPKPVVEEKVIEEVQEKENIVAFEKVEDNKKAKKEKKAKNKKSKAEKNKKEVIVETTLFEKASEEADEYDIFGEKYKDIEKQIAELDDFEDFSVKNEDMLEDTPYEEESIFGDIENQNYEEFSLKKADKSKNKKKGIFNKIMKLNAKEKKQANS